MHPQHQACVNELKAFVRGGPAGLHRLKAVYPSILLHFDIADLGTTRYVMYSAGVPERVWHPHDTSFFARCA